MAPRGPLFASMRDMPALRCRCASTRPIATTRVASRPTSESVRLNAAEAVLSRGWGRPVQAFQVDGNFASRKLNELNNEELAAFEKRLANAEPQQPITASNTEQ